MAQCPGIAHLAHAGVLRGCFGEIARFSARAYALKLSGQDRTSACLRDRDNDECPASKLAATNHTGVKARLILTPDRRKGQAWGPKTISIFRTHGTPPVQKG